MYEIVIRFPSKKVAEEFTGQMSDGFGEGFCDFSVWQETEHPVTKKPKYDKVTDEQGRPICFVNKIVEF